MIVGRNDGDVESVDSAFMPLDSRPLSLDFAFVPADSATVPFDSPSVSLDPASAPLHSVHPPLLDSVFASLTFRDIALGAPRISVGSFLAFTWLFFPESYQCFRIPGFFFVNGRDKAL